MSQGETPPETADDGLRTAVLEIERHAAEAGWDQPARLFALVETAHLLEREPQLAASIGESPLTSRRSSRMNPS